MSRALFRLTALSSSVVSLVLFACGGGSTPPPMPPSADEEVVAIPEQPPAEAGSDGSRETPAVAAADARAPEGDASVATSGVIHGIIGIPSGDADGGLAALIGDAGGGLIGMLGPMPEAGVAYSMPFGIGGPPPAHGHVRFAPPKVSAGLPMEVVRRIFRRNFPRVRYCYDLGLKKRPKLVGLIDLRVKIAPDGRVRALQTAHAKMDDPSVVACIHKHLKGIQFPQPQGGVVVDVEQRIILTPPPTPAKPPKRPKRKEPMGKRI